MNQAEIKDPLTLKGVNKTNHTFTTKLYPPQCNYCIQPGLLSNRDIGHNQDRIIYKIIKIRVLTPPVFHFRGSK